MPTFSNKKPSTSLGRKLRIKSTLVCLLAKQEQKEQEPQEQSSSSTNHFISWSNSDENDALMESVLTQSPLPYNVKHKEDDRDLPFINNNCDSSLDSYDSYQPPLSYNLDDTDKEDDLAEVMFGSPIMEDLSVNFADNHDESAALEPTQEYPSYDDDLDLDASEMAMLDLLVLCDSSGAHHGFYDDLLTLLRRHLKKGFIVSKAKGRDSFLSNMRKHAKCEEEEELPQSAFPYRKDLLFGTDHHDKEKKPNFLIGIVLYTSVITYTSLLPTPLGYRHKVLLDSSWVNILFQNYFGCCQVRIKMWLGPLENLFERAWVEHSTFCIINIMFCLFIYSWNFFSCHCEGNHLLFLIILAIQFSIPSIPYREKNLPYHIDCFLHP